ncbi:MAG: sugar ABC transporter substrate-binding protein [Xanthomonadaceae bacterium]|jgi:multiple sugar transport system substrate-binding protein|nr:sugar ABC transporter substrate-binding protein [Xanthomonadaceae bacterium]
MRIRTLLLLIIVCLTGCMKGEEQRVVRFWAMGGEAEAAARLISDFEHENPGIRVEIQQIPWTSAHEKLLTAFAAGKLPDVCPLGNTWIPEFSTLGALEPLSSYLDASSVIEWQDYFQGIWDTNVVDGQLQGIPWYVDTRLLFYRRDLLAAAGFEQPPLTWEEWERMMAAIKQKAGKDHYAVLIPVNEFEQLLSFALQQGDPLLRDHDRYGNFESAGFKRALAFYSSLFEQGWAPAVSETQISNVWDEFGRGYFVFYISGPWNIGEFKRRLPAQLQDKWMTAPLPGPSGPGAGIAGGASLVLFRSSQHKQEAWKLIEFLSRPDIQRRFYAMTGNLPPRRSSWDDPILAGDPHARAFREQLERVKATPKVLEWERIAQEMRLMSERVVRAGEDQDAATRELNRKVDAILEKRRWVLARQMAPVEAGP